MKPLDVKYSRAAPLRTSPCLVWLCERTDDLVYPMLYITGTTVKVEDVIRMVKNYEWPEKDAKFTVRNVTLGAWNLVSDRPTNQAYFGDARAVDSDGMVQL